MFVSEMKGAQGNVILGSAVKRQPFDGGDIYAPNQDVDSMLSTITNGTA